MSSSTKLALQNAAEALDKALQDLRDGRKTGSSRSQQLEDTPKTVDQDDPDAMAEAFLARQALQKERQNRLEVEEWAQVISRVDLKKEKRTDELPIQVQKQRESLKKALVQQLREEFQRAWDEAS